jgi:hypothetical protein
VAYKVTISGSIVLEKCIHNVYFKVDTPNDYNDMRTSPKNSMIITGSIDVDEPTLELYKWALLLATNTECYKEIVVEHYKSDQLLRKVCFSKAFVIDYIESYSNYSGTGTFTIYLRQFIDEKIECTGLVNQQAEKKSIDSTEKFTENIQELGKDIINDQNTSKTAKTHTSITERIAKQKEILDNSIGEICDDKYWNTVDKYGSTPKERLDQTPINNGEWSGERGESKWTSNIPEVQEQYVKCGIDGIEYKDGLPDFSPVSQFDYQLPEKPVDLVTAKDADQFEACNNALKKYVEDNPEEAIAKFNDKQLKQINAGLKPSGFTWHHSVQRGKMQLVPTRIHQNSGHYGGKNIWGGGTANR